VTGQVRITGSITQIERKQFILNDCSVIVEVLQKWAFKRRKARPWQAGLLIGRTTEERSEGVRAQWQTALGVVMAAGLDRMTKLATASKAHSVPRH